MWPTRGQHVGHINKCTFISALQDFSDIFVGSYFLVFPQRLSIGLWSGDCLGYYWRWLVFLFVNNRWVKFAVCLGLLLSCLERHGTIHPSMWGAPLLCYRYNKPTPSSCYHLLRTSQVVWYSYGPLRPPKMRVGIGTKKFNLGFTKPKDSLPIIISFP